VFSGSGGLNADFLAGRTDRKNAFKPLHAQEQSLQFGDDGGLFRFGPFAALDFLLGEGQLGAHLGDFLQDRQYRTVGYRDALFFAFP